MNRSVIPFALIAAVSIIAGGLLSAAFAYSPSYTASWAVAYLVLVVGVAQLALGAGQAWLAEKPPSKSLIIAEILTLNLANIATLFGTIISSLALVYLGAVLMIISLALFLWGVWVADRKHIWLLYAYRAIVFILMVSAGIGLVIASVKK